MKKIILLFSILTFLFSEQAEITNIQASQRTDGSQIVDITYDLLPDPIFEFFNINVKVSLDGGQNYQNMTYISGDFGEIIEPGNDKTITWNFGQQFEGTYSNEIKIKIIGNSIAFIDNNISQNLPFEVVAVEAGEYTLGENDETRTIDYDYEIMKYEVTDQDYVLFILDVLQNNETEECQDLTNGDGTPWFEEGPSSGWEYYNCDWYFNQGCPDYGDQFNNDLDYSALDACCDCGGGTSSQALNLFIFDNKIRGYYPGDANFAAGNYDYLHFSNSKISWNGEIFEVEEGNVNHPVTGVTWFGAWAFATHYGMEIPDQYEWEKAARGNTGYNYPWGDELSPNNVYNNNVNGVGVVNVTFQVDLSQTETTQDSNNDDGDVIKMRISSMNGEYVSNEWDNMFDLNDNLVFEYTKQLLPGINYGYLYHSSDNGGYESSDNIDYICAGGNYGNERYISTEGLSGNHFLTTNTVGTFNGQILNMLNANIIAPAYYYESCEISPNGYEAGIVSEPFDLNTIDSPSSYGTYDMAGNVWEIVKNDDDSYFIRGGAYNSDTSRLQSWYQESYNGSSNANNIGFRCIRKINQSQSRDVPKEKLRERRDRINKYYLNKYNTNLKN